MAKREITFVAGGKLALALGISRLRLAELEEITERYINSPGANLKNIIECMNEECRDDTEWTAFVFALGVWQGTCGYD